MGNPNLNNKLINILESIRFRLLSGDLMWYNNDEKSAIALSCFNVFKNKKKPKLNQVKKQRQSKTR